MRPLPSRTSNIETDKIKVDDCDVSSLCYHGLLHRNVKTIIVTCLHLFTHTLCCLKGEGAHRKLSSESVTRKNQVSTLNDVNHPSYDLAENLKSSQIGNIKTITLPTGYFKGLPLLCLHKG